MTSSIDDVQMRLELVKLTHSQHVDVRHVLERADAYLMWITGEVENPLDVADRLLAEGTPKGSS